MCQILLFPCDFRFTQQFLTLTFKFLGHKLKIRMENTWKKVNRQIFISFYV